MRENTRVNSTYKLHVCTLHSGRDAAETQTTLMPPDEALKVQAFCSKLSMIDSSQAWHISAISSCQTDIYSHISPGFIHD